MTNQRPFLVRPRVVRFLVRPRIIRREVDDEFMCMCVTEYAFAAVPTEPRQKRKKTHRCR